MKKQNHKTIETKQVLLWKKLNYISYCIPLFSLCAVAFLTPLGRELCKTAIRFPSPSVILFVVLFLVFFALLLSLPLFLLFHAVSRSMRKRTLSQTTFHSVEDFDYYREKLTGLAPCTISLLTDLAIETQKDITALILHYTMLGVVKTDNDKVEVINKTHPALGSSDKILLEMIAQNAWPDTEIRRWKDAAQIEAIEKGYLKGRTDVAKQGKRSCLQGCLQGCLIPIVLVFVWYGLSGWLLGDAGLAQLGTFLDYAPQNLSFYQQLLYLLSDAQMVEQIAAMFVLLLLVIVIFLLPVLALVRFVVLGYGAAKPHRTELGEQLTMQIAGMKNFIHEFSNLSQVQKSHLILWDEFLIYAVVLEENETIVKEIFAMKQFSEQAYTTIKKTFQAENPGR